VTRFCERCQGVFVRLGCKVFKTDRKNGFCTDRRSLQVPNKKYNLFHTLRVGEIWFPQSFHLQIGAPHLEMRREKLELLL